MNNNIKIAKQLIRIAKSLIIVADDDEQKQDKNNKKDEQNKEDKQNEDSSDNKEDGDELDKQIQAKLDKANKAGKKYILYQKKDGLWSIMACKDFNDVKRGNLAGFIEYEDNLSHKGNCWIYGNCLIKGKKTKVYGDATISDSNILEGSQVYGKAVIDNSTITDKSQVFENAHIQNMSYISNSKIYGDANISEEEIKDQERN